VGSLVRPLSRANSSGSESPMASDLCLTRHEDNGKRSASARIRVRVINSAPNFAYSRASWSFIVGVFAAQDGHDPARRDTYAVATTSESGGNPGVDQFPSPVRYPSHCESISIMNSSKVVPAGV
jgi:hypothetical protein